MPLSKNVHILRAVWITALMVALLAATPHAARAQLTVGAPTATFGPGPALTGFSVTVGIKSAGPLSPGDSVTLQYTNAAGAAIGAPVVAAVGAGGVVTVPPPPIPAGATGLGNKVVISYDLGGGTIITAKPLVWYNSAWIGTTAAIKVDPFGVPGITSAQSWFIQETGLDITSTSAEFGSVSSTLLASNFDLVYSDLGGGEFEALISGDDSFMRFSNETYVAFPDGLAFGDIRIDFFDGVTASGTFSFSALGLAGVWNWNSTTNYTGGTSSTPFDFTAPAISLEVPEPATVLLLTAGLAALARAARRRRS